NDRQEVSPCRHRLGHRDPPRARQAGGEQPHRDSLRGAGSESRGGGSRARRSRVRRPQGHRGRRRRGAAGAGARALCGAARRRGGARGNAGPRRRAGPRDRLGDAGRCARAHGRRRSQGGASPLIATVLPVTVAALELDLEVFSGPFDLLLTLVLREEVDLLELELADVVLAYLDHLEARGELDLEAATEFIVLVAALLEIKSRLMLLGDEQEEAVELEPEAAAEELLARMLDAHRF